MSKVYENKTFWQKSLSLFGLSRARFFTKQKASFAQKTITALAVITLVLSGLNMPTIVLASQNQNQNNQNNSENENKDKNKDCTVSEDKNISEQSQNSEDGKKDDKKKDDKKDDKKDSNKCNATIVINKVWVDSEGQPVDAPEDKGDLTITVQFGSKSTDCTYNQNDILTCDKTINIKTPDTIHVTETGIPNGWEVDQSTVGDFPYANCIGIDSVQSLQKNNNDDHENDHGLPVCSHTVINKLIPSVPCGTELVANGGFEAPVVSTSEKWDAFDSGTSGLAWNVSWIRPAGAPAIAKAELHRGVNGWTSHSGSQHTELDSDWTGPSSSQSGEDASVKLSQDLTTQVGHTYTVSLWTSPRPGTDSTENVTKVEMGATTLDTIVEDGSAKTTTDWTLHSYSFVATSTTTTLALSDMGVGNSLGGFVDDVSVKEDCAPPPPIERAPKLHFIKVVCDSYSDVAGNESGDQKDDTNGNYTKFSNYNDGKFTPSPLVNGVVNPSEIPDSESCHRADGWKFTLDDNSGLDSDNSQQVGPTVNGEFVTPISGEGSALNASNQTAIIDGQLWIAEVQQEGYNFAAIRCYNDALNGDNLEYISLGENRPSDIYCIAYNVPTLRPCQEITTPVAIVSDSNTQTAGWTNKNPIASPRDPSLYSLGAFSNSTSANTVIPPWIDPSLAPFAGSGATWISTVAAHPGQTGGEGDSHEDQWRLFQYKFTVPSGVTVTPGNIIYTADNATTVYLNGNVIGDTNPEVDTFATTPSPLPSVFSKTYTKTFTPVAGQENVLEFVLRNSSFDISENPTALLYKADFSYTNDCTPKFKISGNLYNDQNSNNQKDSGEPGLQGWSIKLFKYNTGDGSTDPKDDTTSDSNGDFSFTGLPADCYVLTEQAQNGWGQTEPNVPDHTYYIALGGADCPGAVYTQNNLLNFFVKTAQAATPVFVAYAGDAVLQNFGNVATSGGGGCTSNCGGGGSNGGGSTGDGTTPVPTVGRVLGDTTDIPSNSNPQVLGATTELPRTGTPLSAYLMVFAILGILLIPAAQERLATED